MLFICLAVFGCAANSEITKIKKVFVFEPYSGGHLDQVMVVGKPRFETVRKQYEDYLSAVLKKRGIDAIPSYLAIPELSNVNLRNVAKVAQRDRIKTLLAAKIVGVDEKVAIFKESLSYGYIATPHGVFMQPYIEGPRVEKTTNVRIEAGLFDIQSGKLLWGVTSEVMDPNSVDEAIKDFSNAIINQLIIDGYIR